MAGGGSQYFASVQGEDQNFLGALGAPPPPLNNDTSLTTTIVIIATIVIMTVITITLKKRIQDLKDDYIASQSHFHLLQMHRGGRSGEVGAEVKISASQSSSSRGR